MIPWLAKCDQSKVYPNNITFETPEEQEKVRSGCGWCSWKGHAFPWHVAYLVWVQRIVLMGLVMSSIRWPASRIALMLHRPSTRMNPSKRGVVVTSPTACCVQYVRDWVKKRTGFDSDFKVTFYPGRYAPEKCSILPVGDPTQYIPEHEVSACSHAGGEGGDVPVCSGGGAAAHTCGT